MVTGKTIFFDTPYKFINKQKLCRRKYLVNKVIVSGKMIKKGQDLAQKFIFLDKKSIAVQEKCVLLNDFLQEAIMQCNLVVGKSALYNSKL